VKGCGTCNYDQHKVAAKCTRNAGLQSVQLAYWVKSNLVALPTGWTYIEKCTGLSIPLFLHTKKTLGYYSGNWN